MSTGWSVWIMALVVLNISITLFLFFWGTRVAIPTEKDGTSGHVWAHGVLREGVRKLPMWWYLMSLAVFVIGIGYLVLYPGFGSNEGLLKWTTQGQLNAETELSEELLRPVMESAATDSFKALAKNDQAMHIGGRLFADNCASCHGRDAKGNHVIGAPDLTDSASLYGHSAADIQKSIADGRSGAMPPWASLGYGKIKNLSHYIRSLSGSSRDGASANAGKGSFATCAGCHGVDARGNKALGAPDLTDNASLYGNSIEQLMVSITEGRHGVMPGWKDRLSDAEIRLITAWILNNEGAGDVSQNGSPQSGFSKIDGAE
jgi:cytochrome c oxidase cbb3-type subunit 3